MGDESQSLWEALDNNRRQAMTMQEKLLAAGTPERIYGAPVEAAGHTIITAGESITAYGYGYGGGGTATEAGGDGGTGSGGGGYAFSRPVAVIILDERGARVEPVVDVTKVAIALFTAMAAGVASLARIWRHSRA